MTIHQTLRLVRPVLNADGQTLMMKVQIKENRIFDITQIQCRSQWPRGLRRRSAAARLLGLWVRIPPGGHGCVSV